MNSLVALACMLSIGQAATRTNLNAAIVDLGYTFQQGIFEGTQSGFRYVNYTNIRYAAPPTKQSRFSPPREPIANDTIQKAGNVQIQCPQAIAGWENYVGADVGNLTQMPVVDETDIVPPTVGESEDCLFLDILVPESAFLKRTNIPVILYIHGGGYAEGSKTAYGPGESSGIALLEAAAQDDKAIIYASINYRLGAFGFLAGEQVPSASINLGLQDQIAALKWVNRYISLFGGDPEQIILLGQSAGAGAILHHLASPETPISGLFHSAILQSPWSLKTPPSKQDETFGHILLATNVTSFAQLKQVPAHALQTANKLVVGNAQPYGTFAFGPVADEKGQGRISMPLIFGHTANEGALFTSPFVTDDAELSSYVTDLFPSISSLEILSITESLYPSNFSGDQGYTDQQERLAEIYGDATVVCNTFALGRAQDGNSSFAYEFSVPPAWHSGDLPYLFWDRSLFAATINTTLAAIMQRYITEFAESGSPNSDKATGQLEWPAFHDDSGRVVQNLNSTAFGPEKESLESKRNARCEWWTRNLYT